MELALKMLKQHLPASISIMAAVIGFVAWIAVVGFKVDVVAKSIEKLEAREQSLEEIKLDIAVIKTKITLIEKTMGGN